MEEIKTISSMMDEKRVFNPPEELSRGAYVQSLGEYNEIYQKTSAGRAELLGRVYSGIKYAANGRIAYIHISKKDFEETGTGADVANARTRDITAGGDPVSYTCSAGSDTAVFDIIIEYVEVVDEIN